MMAPPPNTTNSSTISGRPNVRRSTRPVNASTRTLNGERSLVAHELPPVSDGEVSGPVARHHDPQPTPRPHLRRAAVYDIPAPR